ncbi:hypothetical protein AB5N19_01211 [Seiridium cardinale]
MGRVGRPARNSRRPEQHKHENSQSLVPMDLASLVGIAEQLQDQTGVWKGIFGGHETGPLPPEWAGASSSQAEVPSSVFHRPARDISYDISAVSQTNGGIARQDNRGNKDIAPHHYPISSMENSGCHQTSFMLGDAPNGRIAPSATGTNDDPVQASPSSSRQGQPATRMHRLLVLQSRILLQGDSSELKSCSQPGLGYSTKGKLDHLLKNCSDLTAILAEVDNPTETQTTSPGDNNLSTWLGLTPTDSDGVWSDSHLSNSPFCSGSSHTDRTTTTTVFDPPATRGSRSQEHLEPTQTRVEAEGKPHTPFTVQSSTRSQDSPAHEDVVVVLTATACYIQLMRSLHCVLSKLYDALVAGDDATLSSLWSAATYNVMLPKGPVKNTLQAKIAVEIVLHVLDCLEERMGLPVLNAGTSNTSTQAKVLAFPRNEPFLSVVSAAVDAEDACRISQKSAAEITTQEDMELSEGVSRREAQSVVRAQIQKISDYISRKPLF